MKTQQQGFTLIELMIVVLTLAILATIAYPSYETYVRQTRLENVRADLMINAQMMERYYAQNKRFPNRPADTADDAERKKLTAAFKKNSYFGIAYQQPDGNSAANPIEDNYVIVASANKITNPREDRYMKIDGNGVVTLCKSPTNAAASAECYMYK
ncbi:type IV pilin protein [Neisseria dentiae]|uniref:type IV pilin protein n=1 Tax=Neisseria dentiae TaxID=194197 RepID=UPI0027BA1D99|nr:type IV pilin protein [Neisseria dentiae]